MFRIVFALIVMVSPVMAEPISLDQISAYLNGLKTAQAGFVQYNADGSVSSGKLYIRRPGRLRFEYNPPDEALVIAGGGSVAVFDRKSNEDPARYPLGQTPLKVLLERDVDLAKRDVVVDLLTDGTRTAVTLQDPDQPGMGNMQLIFISNPTRLIQWVVTDESRSKTAIVLDGWTEGGKVPNILFNIQAEMDKRD